MKVSTFWLSLGHHGGDRRGTVKIACGIITLSEFLFLPTSECQLPVDDKGLMNEIKDKLPVPKDDVLQNTKEKLFISMSSSWKAKIGRRGWSLRSVSSVMNPGLGAQRLLLGSCSDPFADPMNLPTAAGDFMLTAYCLGQQRFFLALQIAEPLTVSFSPVTLFSFSFS